MLEKNKDYIEMRVHSTDCGFTQNAENNMSIEGYTSGPYWFLPDPGETYIVISKEKFDRLQANVSINAELAKQWEINYNLLEQEIKIYSKALQDWKEITGYPSPSAVKAAIESGVSWHHAYNQVVEKNRKLTDDVNSWKNVTGYSTPESCLSDRINNTCKIQKWKEATGCSTPEEAKEFIDNKKKRINELKDELDTSLDALEEAHDRTTEMEDLCMERREQIQSLYKIIEGWNKVTGCSTLEEAKDWVNELGEANGNLAQAVLSWQNVTGCSCPKDLSKKIVEWEKVFTPHMSARDLSSAMSNAIESYKHKFAPWQEITGFSTPENCISYIDTLEKKLDDIKDLIKED